MIRSLEVKELNNRLTDKFEFHEDLNIFTGPNGSCKTTLLKLIWYLISGNLQEILVEIPFYTVSIQTDLFNLTMERVKPDQVTFDYNFDQEKGVCEFVVINAETRRIDRKDVDWVNTLEKRIARTTKQSLFFPTFRRIEGGFSRVTTNTDDSTMRFLASTPEMLQVSMLRFADEVSVNGHKFIASISTGDLKELLTEKYADIYEEISIRQSQVLEDISRDIQDASGAETSQNAPAVLDAIKNVSSESEQLRKPFSVLVELSRKILRYDAIRVNGRVVRGETTDGITLGAGKDGVTVGEAKDAISSDKLSAGEKQMLSFLCYNAFSEDTTVFIDEPELSLHVDWEGLLLPTLLKQSTGNQFFVATHSPFIYTIYPDKEFMLEDDKRFQREI